MIIVLTNSGDVTADFMCLRLRHEGARFVRLDSDRIDNIRFQLRDFVITLTITEVALRPTDVECVWLRRPKIIEIHQEDPAEARHTSDEWAEALESFLVGVDNKKWINHPSSNASAAHKPEQILRANDFGLHVPDTLITQNTTEAVEFIERHQHRVIVKPISGGYLERADNHDTQIYTSRITDESLLHIGLLESCPTLFQGEIAKRCDVRVCVIDSEYVAIALHRREHDMQILDIRRDNMHGVSYSPIDVPSSVLEPLRNMLRSYSLRFAAVDFVIDRDNKWHFLEINPNGQWAWLDLLGHADIAGSLHRAMTGRIR